MSRKFIADHHNARLPPPRAIDHFYTYVANDSSRCSYKYLGTRSHWPIRYMRFCRKTWSTRIKLLTLQNASRPTSSAFVIYGKHFGSQPVITIGYFVLKAIFVTTHVCVSCSYKFHACRATSKFWPDINCLKILIELFYIYIYIISTGKNPI